MNKVKGLYRVGEIWYLRMPSGRKGKYIRKSLKTTSLREAQKIAKLEQDRNFIYSKTKLPRFSPRHSNFSFKDAIAEFLKYSKNLRKRATHQNHKKRLYLILDKIGDRELQDIDHNTIYDFIEIRRDDDEVQPITIKNDLDSFRALFTYFRKKRQLIYHNPFDIVNFKAVANKPEYLSLSEVNKLLKHIPKNSSKHWLMFLIRLALASGFRRGELLNLKWKHFNGDKSLITIFGKTGDRLFPYYSTIRRIVDDYSNFLPLWHKYAPRIDDYFFYPHNKPSQRYNDDYVSRGVKEIFNDLKFPDSYKLHTLRHTFGAHRYKNGMKLEKLKILMGHKNLQTTELYAHITMSDDDLIETQDYLLDEVQQFDSYFNLMDSFNASNKDVDK